MRLDQGSDEDTADELPRVAIAMIRLASSGVATELDR